MLRPSQFVSGKVAKSCIVFFSQPVRFMSEFRENEETNSDSRSES